MLILRSLPTKSLCLASKSLNREKSREGDEKRRCKAQKDSKAGKARSY
jgi:hypothetical protein